VQDGIYPSRNLATLGPSGLRPPFTGTYKTMFFSFNSTGQMSDFIHHISILQNLMFLLNSRRSFFFLCTKMPSFSRSYRVKLSSSFNIINPFALFFSKNLLVLEFNTIIYLIIFQAFFSKLNLNLSKFNLEKFI